MGSPLSSDLRARVLNAVEEGTSRRRAADRFAVSPSSAIRWRKSLEEDGRTEAKPLGGDRRSHHVEAHADLILNLYEERPTIFLSELRAILADRGITTSESGLCRFFKRHGITRKKTRRTLPSRTVPM